MGAALFLSYHRYCLSIMIKYLVGRSRHSYKIWKGYDMRKRFNVNGACIPDIHYMVKIDERLKDIGALIDAGEYFTINRARQFGKTTTLMCLEKYLSERYIILSMSFEGIDGGVFAGETEFCRHFLKLLYTSMDYGEKEGVALEVIKECENKLKDTGQGFGFWELSILISRLCSTAEKPVVLMIDEVDQAGGYERFLTFLGMLRNKYLMRMKIYGRYELLSQRY